MTNQEIGDQISHDRDLLRRMTREGATEDQTRFLRRRLAYYIDVLEARERLQRQGITLKDGMVHAPSGTASYIECLRAAHQSTDFEARETYRRLCDDIATAGMSQPFGGEDA